MYENINLIQSVLLLFVTSGKKGHVFVSGQATMFFRYNIESGSNDDEIIYCDQNSNKKNLVLIGVSSPKSHYDFFGSKSHYVGKIHDRKVSASNLGFINLTKIVLNVKKQQKRKMFSYLLIFTIFHNFLLPYIVKPHSSCLPPLF